MIGRLDEDEWLEARETDGMRRCREMERDWNSTQVKNGFIDVWKFNVNVCHVLLPECHLSFPQVFRCLHFLRKRMLFIVHVCAFYRIRWSYNKVVTDLANQQTVLYLRQPEHRGNLCLTDGCGVCVRAHACSHFVCVTGWSVAALCMYVSIFWFVCIYTHWMCYCIFLCLN